MKNIRSKFWRREVQTGLYIFAAVFVVLGRAGVLDQQTAWTLLVVMLGAAYALRHFTEMRYRDYVLEPVRPDELPRDTYTVFNNCTPEFMQLGCGLVGDFRLAYGPYPVFVRYLLPPDDRVKGEVCDWNGTFTPSFTTYFADGRLLESVISAQPGQKLSNDSKLWFFKCGPIRIADLYQRHCEAIGAYEASHHVSAIKVTPERLAEFAQYGHRLVWWEKGKLPPYLSEPSLREMEPVLLEAVSLRS